MEEDSLKPSVTLDLSSPKPSDKEFTKYWNTFMVDIKDRKNLKPGHLMHLKLYCSMFVQADVLEIIIDTEGHTFTTPGGRNGPQVKTSPESVAYMNLLKEIRQYSVMLGLTLVEDAKMTNDADEDKNKGKRPKW